MTSLYLYLSGCGFPVWRVELISQWQRVLYPVHAAWRYDITICISFRVRIPSLMCRAYLGVTARPLPSPCSIAEWHLIFMSFRVRIPSLTCPAYLAVTARPLTSPCSTAECQNSCMTSLYLVYLSGRRLTVWRVEPIPQWQRVLYPVHAARPYDITIFISFRVQTHSLTCRAYPAVTARPLPSPCSTVVCRNFCLAWHITARLGDSL